MQKIHIALAALIALGAAAAAAPSMAADTPFTPLPLVQGVTSVAGASDSNVSGTSIATFTDDFAFTILTPANSAFTAALFEGMPASNNVIDSVDLSIFQGIAGVGTDTLLATTGTVVDPTPGVNGVFAAGLSTVLQPNVNYYLQATITVPGGDVGQYSVAATPAAISSAPEPGTWALMFAGVAMIGGALRMSRRGSKLATA